MEKPSRVAAECHAALLRKLVQHAYHDGNSELSALADTLHPAMRCATQADFHYVDPHQADSAAHTIPIAQFHRQYALCLQMLELSIYGYCIQKQFGRERKSEPVFSMRRPALWRRALRPAPLLELRVRVEQGGSSISISGAQRAGYANKVNCVVRLDQELQQQLTAANSERTALRPVKNRVGAWLAGWRAKLFKKE